MLATILVSKLAFRLYSNNQTTTHSIFRTFSLKSCRLKSVCSQFVMIMPESSAEGAQARTINSNPKKRKLALADGKVLIIECITNERS